MPLECTASYDDGSLTSVAVGAHRALVSAELVQLLPSLGVDVSDPLELAGLAFGADPLASAVASGWLDRPLSAKTRESYTTCVSVFSTWCATRTPAFEPLALSHEARVAVVGSFLGWLAVEADAGDPAVGFEPGKRMKPAPLAGGSLAMYNQALRWWAECNGIANPVPAAAADLVVVRKRERPARKAAAITREQLKILVAKISEGPEACGFASPLSAFRPGAPYAADYIVRWVASNKAAVLVQYHAALRISERLRLRDEWVVAGEGRLVLRWPKTKHRPSGRTVDLFGDPDPDLCPLRSLAHWLDVATTQGLDRHGFLLPEVTTRGLRCSGETAPVLTRFKRIVAAAGLEAGLDFEKVFVGTHGLRRGAAVDLASVGVELDRIGRHIGHLHLDNTAQYLDHAAPPTTDWSSELGL